MIKLIKIIPLIDYKLELWFDDGTHGVLSVNLPDVIFNKIKSPDIFNSVEVWDNGACIKWNDDVEIDSLSQYMKITWKQLFIT